MIIVQDHKVTALYYVDLVIKKVAYGAKTIWEMINSCFGSGVWKEDYNWKENDNWKENL